MGEIQHLADARAKAQERKRIEQEENVRAAYAALGEKATNGDVARWCKANREVRYSPFQVREIRKRIKWNFSGPTGKNAQTVDSTEHDDTPAWKKLLAWDVLKLFDNLETKFENEEDKEEGHDSRLTWFAWRVFLASIFALPVSRVLDSWSDVVYPGVQCQAVERGAANIPPGASVEEIFSLCTGRRKWPDVVSKIVALIVGRRGGKSYITAVIGIYLACCRHYLVKLGTKPMVMILARDREQAGVIRNYIKAFLHALEETKEMIANETEARIELRNGVVIEVRAVSDSGAGTRGYTVVAALLDEVAFWPTDNTSKKQDRSVLRALRPSMFGIRWRTEQEHGTGAMIVMLSSPYAKRGVLFDYWLAAYGKELQEGDKRPILAWQADTLSMRPENDPDLVAEIEAEYEEDPENAKAEYGAQWRSDLEAIFSKESVERICAVGTFERPYVASNAPYRAFVDPSGGSSDSYVIAIAHDEKREENGETFTVPVLDKVIEWIPKFDPELVSAEVAAACKDYRISSVTGDAYGGEWPRDPLKKKQIAYTVSERNRSELYLDFLPVVNSGRCQLLDATGNKTAKRGVNQLVNLERRTGRSGKDAVDHPPNSHDDVANAIAGVMTSGTTIQYRIRRPNISRQARPGETMVTR